jgi:hypothetical protein
LLPVAAITRCLHGMYTADIQVSSWVQLQSHPRLQRAVLHSAVLAEQQPAGGLQWYISP